MLNPSRHALSLIKGLLWLTLACCGTAWAYDDYSGCETCHGDFNSGVYESNHDGASWGTDLMDGHGEWVPNCDSCHQAGGFSDVLLNQSADGTFSKSCVGCHGRDEDVTGNCVGDDSPVECGSGAGLRRVHESVSGANCSACHTGDAAPVGENVKPFNYSLQASAIADSCDADGTESQFGTTGLDNDGDGERDAADSDCSAFGINAGMNDAWYNPATNGQGFLVTVFEDAGLVFLAWFTYDVERPPEDVTAILGDPGHRWVTAQGPYEGDTATLDVYISSGGVFDSPEPVVPAPVKDGTMTIKWNDCTSATLTYDIASAGQGEIPLQRIVNDNVALCEAL